MSDTQVTSASGEYRLEVEPHEVLDREPHQNRRDWPVILYRGGREVARVLAYNPDADQSVVTDDGTFAIADWGPLKKQLCGILSVFNANGTPVFERRFKANLAGIALSPDARRVLVQTLVSPDSDGSSLFLFDVPTSKLLWQVDAPLTPTRWIFAGERILAVVSELGRFPVSLDGTFAGRDLYEKACVGKGEFRDHEPVVRSWIQGAALDGERIEFALENADRMIREEDECDPETGPGYVAYLLRFKGELYEAKGEPAEALRCYRSALARDPKVGIKRRANALEKELPADVVKALRKEIPLKEEKPKRRSKATSAGTPTGSFRLVAFDLETTGLDPATCEIIEIGAVKFDLDAKTRDTFQRFAKPSRRIPKVVVEKTGITDAMVANALPPWSAVDDFERWAGPDATLVVHNASFDIGFLNAVYDQANRAMPSWKVVDTLTWAQRDNLGTKNNQLQTLLKFIGKNSPTQHRALHDAQGAAHLMVYLASKRKNVRLAVTRRMVSLEEAAFPPASQRQLEYLHDLGARESELVDVDRRRASELIDRYKTPGTRKGSDTREGCLPVLLVVLAGLFVIYLMTC